MRRSDIVRLVDASADRLPLRSLIVIACIGTMAGSVLAYATAGSTESSQASGNPAADAAPVPKAIAASPDNRPSAEREPPRAPAGARTTPAVPPPVEIEATRSEPAASSPAPKAIAKAQPPKLVVHSRAFTRGAVAYLRCEGAERKGARFPCPRDHGLETAVWRILEDLGKCSVADPGRGDFEARLTWTRDQPIAVEWRSTADNARSDFLAVSKCAGKRFAAVHPQRTASHAITAFRFKLR